MPDGDAVSIRHLSRLETGKRCFCLQSSKFSKVLAFKTESEPLGHKLQAKNRIEVTLVVVEKCAVCRPLSRSGAMSPRRSRESFFSFGESLTEKASVSSLFVLIECNVVKYQPSATKMLNSAAIGAPTSSVDENRNLAATVLSRISIELNIQAR